jgi:hypothetical protein
MLARRIAQFAHVNATAIAKLQQAFVAKQLLELASNCSASTRELRDAVEKLSDLRFQYAQLLKDQPNDFNSDRDEGLDLIVYVLGGANHGTDPAVRDFPVLRMKDGESERQHLARVAQAVGEIVAQGGTHLLVPRKEAEWLSDYLWLADYFAQQHELAGSSPESGILFLLHSEMS